MVGRHFSELFISVCLLLIKGANSDQTFVIGYISGNRLLEKSSSIGDYHSYESGKADFTLPGLRISAAIGLAVDEIGRDGVLPEGYKLSFLVAETHGIEELSIRQTAELGLRQNVSAYIGPQETCVHEARIAASFNLPMISHFCSHYGTSNKKLYPTFARTRPPATFVSKSAATLLLRYNWTRVAFFHSNINGSEYGDVAEAMVQNFQEYNIEIKFRRSWSELYHHGWRDVENFFSEWVEETYSEVRIYLVLGESDCHLGLLEALHNKGLLANGEYFVVGIRADEYDSTDPGKYLKGYLKQHDTPSEATLQGLRHYLGIMMSPPQESDRWSYKNFTKRVKEHMLRGRFADLLGTTGVRLLQLRREAAYLYDAVKLYAWSLNRILRRGLGDPLNGTLVIEQLKRRSYFSAMGYDVFMDSNGDAEGNYTLVALSSVPEGNHGQGLVPVGTFNLDEAELLPILQLTEEFAWPNGKPPLARPVCGFQGELCLQEYAACEIAMGVVGGVAVVLSVVMIVAYRNYRYEQELDSLLWKVDPKELKIDENTPTNSALRVSRLPSHHLARNSQVSLSSNPDADFRFSTIYTRIGVYKGRIFAVKRTTRHTVDITRKLKKELKVMRDLRHDNLNSFVGACVEPGNVCIISEYCTRGSLRDILDNEDVKLDNMFIASLVGDIVRGMIYLHDSPLRYHGNLKTSNCLVDSRWVLKISDFGLQDFKSDWRSYHDIVNDMADANPFAIEELLYRAPELLRCENALGNQCETALQKADVYSFAIILYELHGRRGPFGEVEMTAIEILDRVSAPDRTPPFRPQIDLLENCFDFVRSCLKDAWAENPEERPDFKIIRARLRPLRKGMKANIFDNMIAMMEKYANNLEAIVDERTQLLIDEKRKTEALLYEMLPRPVAEQLKQGKRVDAESFDCVTIFFSDIVGFTSMSAESTALQVVDFLNDLYTMFDSVLENFDVYKVETIGDAYMVVSGLPIRNADQHAGEIASMGLQLLESIKKFQIRHRPSDTLMLRAGVHSGSVCAGVVGQKMPRYCLFGDTVNTASRMESTGLPLKIHCSRSCRDILHKLGGYEVEERGFVNMKGKGDQLTYWIKGEDADSRARRVKQRARYLSSQRHPPQATSFDYDMFRSSSLAMSRRGSSRKSAAGSANRLTPNGPESPGRRIRFGGQTSTRASVGSIVEEDEVVPNYTPRSEKEFTVPTPGHPEFKRNSCPCIEETVITVPSVRAPARNQSATPAPSVITGIKSVCHASLSSLFLHSFVSTDTQSSTKPSMHLRGGPTSNGGTSASLQRSSTVDENRKPPKRKSLRHSLRLPLFSQSATSATSNGPRSAGPRSSPIKEDAEGNCAKEQNLPLLNEAVDCDV